MTTVRKLLEAKGKAGNYSVSAEDTVLQALKVMTSAGIGAVLVTDGGKIVGIYTERDYVQKGELEGRRADSTLVRDVMTAGMYTVTMETTVDQCMALMETHHIRHLPVVEK
ncbi:MAG: CBS domain-containing protein, partial [Anaerolineales bacterium]|nr:CBS domain-containing protein [Anaerolineales bacterium]